MDGYADGKTDETLVTELSCSLSLTKLFVTEHIPSILMFAAKRRLNMTAFDTSAHKVHDLFIFGV